MPVRLLPEIGIEIPGVELYEDVGFSSQEDLKADRAAGEAARVDGDASAQFCGMALDLPTSFMSHVSYLRTLPHCGAPAS
jgi:hypothetical protein